MASIVDIAPALGHALVTAQGGAATGYDAIDDRRFWGVGKQEGTLAPGAWKVTPGTTGLTVTVAADVDGALVQGDAVAAQGLYYVAPHAAPVTLDLAPADPTNPRNDLVVLEVRDDAHDALGTTAARLRVVTGTPTAGATELDVPGINGTPDRPDSALLLAVVNVPANASTVASTDILDRRAWARGLYLRAERTAGDLFRTGGAGLNWLSSNLAPRVECSGAPVRISVLAKIQIDNGNEHSDIELWEVGATSAKIPGTQTYRITRASGDDSDQTMCLGWEFVPSPGSHQFRLAMSGGAAGQITLYANASSPAVMVIEEVLRDSADNA